VTLSGDKQKVSEFVRPDSDPPRVGCGFERDRPSVEAPGRDVDDYSPSLTRP